MLPKFLASRIFKVLFIAFFMAAAAIALSVYLFFIPKLPSPEQLRDTKLQVPLRVYSRNLKLIGEFGEKRRIPLVLDEVPPLFIKAVLAAEDDRFYQHGGVDITGLLRAASELISSGHIQSGGSTITMQVARNFFLTNDQTFARKFNEILLALMIEREFSKNEILELYINKIYLGNRAYGLGAAAQIYYGLKAENLNLAQMAMLAGLPKAPSTKNPLVNPEAALTRRNWILGRMLKLNYIDQTQHDLAIQELLSARTHELKTDYEAPYAVEMARQFAIDKFGEAAYTDGYKVITTIDEELQLVAQHAAQSATLQYDSRHGYRGVEGHVDVPAGESDPQAFYLSTLKLISNVGGLEAGIITAISPVELTVLVGQEKIIQLKWEDIHALTAPYINENNVGETPKKIENVFRIGDIIRLLPSDIDGIKKYQLSQIPRVQAALVSLNPNNGAIVSLVGGFDFYYSKYNRITQAKRQPGSNFKPFFYTTALENGFNPATLVNDSPIVFEDSNLENAWRPENAGGKFLGPIRLRKALYLSRNLVSIRLLKSIGIQAAVNGATRFGFSADVLPKNLSLALGSLSVPPLAIATGYASFANGGYKIEPYLVQTVTDLIGNIIYEAKPLTVCRECDLNQVNLINTELTASDEKLTGVDPLNKSSKTTGVLPVAPRIMDKQTAYLMDSMLKDVVKRGTATRALELQRDDIAGKTGTTNGPTDVWFSGYSSYLVATSWLGFDNNQNLGRSEYGGTAALPMWMEYMQSALKGLPEVTLPQPEGMVTIRIDEKTGLRARPGQTDTLFEIFRASEAPTEEAPLTKEQSPTEDTPQEIMPDEMF